MTRAHRWRRHARASVLLVVLAAALGGCGEDDSDGASAPSAETVAAPSTTPAQTAAPEAPTFAVNRRYEWEVRGESGATAKVKLDFGHLVPASETLPSEFESFKSACTIDPQRDAVIPIRLGVENTTSDFDLTPAIDLAVNKVGGRGGDYSLNLEAATSFTEGPSCDALTAGSTSDGTGVKFEPVTPNNRDGQNWLLVVHDYRSPEYPDGDDTLLQDWFGFLRVRDSSSSMRSTCFTAPPNRYVFVGGATTFAAVSPGFPIGDLDIDANESGNSKPECS